MIRRPLALLAAVAATAAAPSARAQVPYSTALVERPVTLPGGIVELRLELKINMSKDAVGKPLILAPDLYFGVNSDLMIGIDHTNSLCFGDACPRTYNDVGFDLLYTLGRGKVEVAFHGGFYALNLDPSVLQVRAGAALKIHATDSVAVLLDPQLGIGVNKRDLGNKEQLRVPVTIAYQATHNVAPFLETGLYGPLNDFGDRYAVPVGVGVLYGVSGGLDLGARFVFDRLIAANGGGTDARFLGLFLNVRF